jgi:predicted Zn-ribbon and HTH transcriptional regulator
LTNDSKEAKITETIIQVIKEKNPQTVEQLTTLVKEKTKIPEKEILDHIIKLQNTGKIRLTKQMPPTPMKLGGYLKTEQAIWYWATITIAIATVAAVFTIPENFYPWIYIRYALGTIFILWLPGYTFIKALFPEKELDSIERIALSIGMSLALVPIVGLLLNYTPFGIRLTPITLSLLALTLTFATAALIREHKTVPKQNIPHHKDTQQ